jgi:hypothetical protein
MKPQVVAFALGLMLISAGESFPGTIGGTVMCGTGCRFEPGPIVNGHHRQPTPREIEARLQRLQALNKARACSCLDARSGSGTSMVKQSRVNLRDRVVERDRPSSQKSAMTPKNSWLALSIPDHLQRVR